ncbi:sugar transferase [Candidatus Peregrinibacteria bacterium]|nr:sugar transferase [Candidatus Peregrinibacteria bacterium]
MKNLVRFIDQKGLQVVILVASDIFWYCVAFFAAYYARNNIGPSEIQPLEFYLGAIPYMSFLLIIIFYLNGLYEQKQRINKISEIFLVTKAASFTLLLIMAGSFLEKVDYSRALVLLFWPSSIFFLNFGRYLIRYTKKKLMKRGYGIINILIIGAGKPGKRLANEIEEYRDFGYNIVGFLDDRVKPRKGRYKFLGQTIHLMEVIKKRNIHQVFISDPSISHAKILEMIHVCEELPVKFKVVSDLFEIVVGNIDINEIEGIPSIDFKKDSVNIVYRIAKRIIDILLCGIGCIVSLPFSIIICLLIKLDSKGPILFSHPRVGQHGKHFRMYKFRTMHLGTKEEDFAPTDQNDPRITKIGHFLRKTSFDELPQLWNVLRGEMSLVGPRPEMPFLVEKYTPWQKKRLDVKPGITGLWQILGRKDLPLAENLEYDFYYIKNRSLILDFVIIFKTIIVVLTGRGAY